MAASIGNLNIGVTLDGSQAQQGLANLVSTLDQFSAKVARAAAIGSFLGNLTFKAFETSVRGAVNMLETLSRKILQIRLDADKTKFNDMIAKGADPTQVVKSKEFNESVLGGMTRLSMAWDDIIEKVTSIFGPAISGALTGASVLLEVFGKNLASIFDPNNFSLQNMFENMYKITLGIASTLVEAGATMLKFFNDASLLFNKTVVKEAVEDGTNWLTNNFPNIAKTMWKFGLYNPDKTREQTREKNMNEARKNGDLDAAQKVIDAGKLIDGFKNRAVEGLAKLAQNPPKFDKPPEEIARKAGLKIPEAKQFDPMSIFGSSAGRNSDEAYRSRMMLQYKDLFPEGAEGNEQVKAIRDNTNVLGDKLDGIASALGGLAPAGVMDFGVA